MCMGSSPPPPPAVKLPEPVKPIEPAQLPKLAPPPPPAKTAAYLGKPAESASKVTASPNASRGFSSLRIRPRSNTGLNVPS